MGKLETNYVTCDNCEMHYLCLPFEVAGKSVNLVDNILHRRMLVKKGEKLFSEGDPFTSFHGISAGSFKLTVLDDPNRVAGFSFSGELMDAGAFYTDNHCFDALALEDSYVCTMSKVKAIKIGQQIPEFQGRLIKMMSKQLFYANRLMVLLTGRRNADERLAAFLVGLSIRFLEHGYSSKQFHLSMSRDDIASYLGLAKCTVSRILARFHRNGLIVYSGKYFKVTDSEKLKTFASLPDIVSLPDNC